MSGLVLGLSLAGGGVCVGATSLSMDCLRGLIDHAAPMSYDIRTCCPLCVKYLSPSCFSPAVDRALLLAFRDLVPMPSPQ